jgi:DDE superfamily endonuclease/Helix-turn-helix of DDE superfamily endonuclease
MCTTGQLPYSEWSTSDDIMHDRTGLTVKQYGLVYKHIFKHLFTLRQRRMITTDNEYLPTPHNMLLLTLYYLRRYRSIDFIAHEFRLSHATLHHIISTTLDSLCIYMVPSLIDFLHSILSTSPQLDNIANNIKLIVDSTPICIPQPKSKDERKKYYHIKSHTNYAVKFQIATSLSGMIVSVSDVVHGSMHDNKLFKQSPLPALLNDNCQVLGDKGYMGNKHVIIPHKKRKHSEITSSESAINKIQNSVRVVVENVFHRIKQYRIVGTVYQGEKTDTVKISSIVKVVCALTNLIMQDQPVRA